MPNAAGYAANVGTPSPKDFQVVTAEYDFDNDGGATGDLTLMTFNENCLLHRCWIEVETACTSGGSMTLDLQINDAANGIVAAQAVAGLTASAYISGTAGRHVASGDELTMSINVAALTAGKFKVFAEISKAFS